jgi:hypothetical protein
MIRGGLLRIALPLVFLSLTIWGCDAVDSLKGGFQHSQAVSAELEKSLGVKPFVGFNWNNGLFTSVNVTFEGIPKEKSLPEIGEVATMAVLKEFKQEPKQIVLSFMIKP